MVIVMVAIIRRKDDLSSELRKKKNGKEKILIDEDIPSGSERGIMDGVVYYGEYGLQGEWNNNAHRNDLPFFNTKSRSFELPKIRF